MKSTPDISPLLPDDETLRARRKVLAETVGGASRRHRQVSSRRVVIAIAAMITLGGGAAWAANLFVKGQPGESVLRQNPVHDVGAVWPSLVHSEVTAFHLPKGQTAYSEVSPSRGAAGKLLTPPDQVPTYVIAVEPVDANHQPVGGLKIEERGAAQSCSAGSDFAGNVYRCFGGHSVYDPCWKDDADPSATAVLCQGAPWDDRLYHLTLQQPGLQSFHSPPVVVGGDNAWGLELTTGERCLLLQGAHSYVGDPHKELPESRVIDYYCQSKTGKQEARVLLRGIDRSNPRWRIATAYSTKRGYKLGPKVGIAKAWYAAQE